MTWLCVGVFSASFLFLEWGIGACPDLIFSERVYVPVAAQMLKWAVPGNLEHPPLGKELIAAGMAVLGDRPEGWRLASAVFGSLTLVGVFLCAFSLFRSAKAAFATAVLTALNQVLYVMSRVALLDVFLEGFLSFALFGWILAGEAGAPMRTRRRGLLLSGICFGLATASKWNGAVFCFFFAGLAVIQKTVPRLFPGSEDPRRLMSFEGFAWRDLLLAFVALPVIAYLLPFFFYFLPADWHFGASDLLRTQVEMFQYQWHYAYHPFYASQWWEWVLMTKVMVFHALRNPGVQNEIILIGNPLIMGSGLIALLYCVWRLLRGADFSVPAIILFSYVVFLMPWLLMSRSSAAYYYYLSSSTMLGFALAYLGIHLAPRFSARSWLALSTGFLAAALLLFCYFRPVLTFEALSPDQVSERIWLRSWIPNRG